MDYISIGKRIQELRQQCGYTQEALAESVNLSPSYLSHIERASKKASLESLVRIAEALEVSLDWLLNGADGGCEKAFLPETQSLLGDCSPKERRILFETAKAVKQILRDSERAA